MSYYAYSRKYRPQTFADVLAQKHITETLTKAIEHNRVSQAYLFCGVRGTGKTSVARVLAKRLNCAAPVGPEPCNNCDSCLGIIKGRSLDILEIDAASHTSVDDIRELREAIKYAPVGGKYKVYIIDEVHRLSGSAFDALLKTLEEPPAHAVFIFATTEVHKVPQTILSRCQRYDFKRIPESELRSALQGIAGKENLKITDDALAELAKRGDGSLRDSLSILDQVASWQHDIIDMRLLTDALGILPRSEYRILINLIRTQDATGIINRVDSVLKAGVGAAEFIRGFQEELRMLLVLKAAPDLAAEYGITEEEAAEYREIGGVYSLSDLLRIQNLLIALEQKLRDGFDPVINIELAFLKLMQMESSVTIEAAIKALSGGELPTQPVQTSATESKKKLELARPAPKPTAAQAQPPTAVTPADGTSNSAIDLQGIWQKFLTALKPQHRNLQIKLSLAQPRSIEGNKFSVAFDRLGEVHVRYFQDRTQQQTLESFIREVSGRDFRFHFFVDPNWTQKPEGNGNGGAMKLGESERDEHPLVARAVEIFDAEIIARRDLKDK
jgi:DNA polymerase-3 subunit gamma/tau